MKNEIYGLKKAPRTCGGFASHTGYKLNHLIKQLMFLNDLKDI
jgi:hypothetical protein